MAPTIPMTKDDTFWQEAFRWLASNSQGWEYVGKWVVIAIFSLSALLWAIGYVLDKLTKIFEYYKSSGWPVSFNRKAKEKVRKRRQFCQVLNADLSVLAKAENWNDQYFTDLEAEVEAEGGYYLTALHRLFRRKSRGLRRASSLIEAIESSTEQALLLVGEPGSGKSVALRHLAHQFAQRGIRSADPKSRVPLYINLKELSASWETPNADSIKAFILDNIRRGDSDTVDYVRDNWEDLKSQGIWFFLFDSFDEIPAVLHAPSGSSVILDYAEAIRQFLEGLGGCRGVLASREFKGPEALPWQKLRIMPLNEKRQDLLVNNSFLETGQKDLVRRHLAASSSALGTNPMFLTLLCRYVKELGRAPANDHDLLSGHLERLSTRDRDYINRKYGLAPADLIQGALHLAVLFATSAKLSLAPTLDEIAFSMSEEGLSKFDLENILAALVDVKILRSDVQEAKPGDRRFTFSHRRYQETLFVRFIANNPTYLSPAALLTDGRWREYAVTLLQTQEVVVVAPLLEEACNLLEAYQSSQPSKEIDRRLGGGLVYFNWEGDPSASLLGLLQEGLARRLPIVTARLSEQIAALLSFRWEHGDVYDRMMVIKLGGLLPQSMLSNYLLSAVNSSSRQMRALSFQQAIFVSDLPQNLAKWVRVRLSQRLLVAEKRGELLRLEALSARLPNSVGTSFVLRRCLVLRKLLLPLQGIAWPIFGLANILPGFSRRPVLRVRFAHLHFLVVYIGFWSMVMLVIMLVEILSPGSFREFLVGNSFAARALLAVGYGRLDAIPLYALPMPLLALIYCFTVLWLYIFRSVGQGVDLQFMIRGLASVSLFPLVRMALILAFPVILLYFVPGIFFVTWIAAFLIAAVGYTVKALGPRVRLKELVGLGLTGIELILRAKSFDELRTWLEGAASSLSLSREEARSLMRLFLEMAERGFHPSIERPLFRSVSSSGAAERVLYLIEGKILKDL